jgi:hypothetical protein
MSPQVRPAEQSQTGRAMINIFDGKRLPYSGKAQLLITALDGNQQVQHRDFHHQPSLFLTGLPLFNNFGDQYTFLASANGYKDAGFFPVKLAANVTELVNLMLIPKSNQLNFANATWSALSKSRPELKALLAQGADSSDAAAQRYGDIQEDQGGVILACLLNITTAMQQIHLPKGSPFDYLKGVIWDRDGNNQLAQDRFFAWADPVLIDQVKQAQAQNPPEFVSAPFGLHPGATSSYKQVEFGEANVQLTFHENDRTMIGGVNCVMVEPDIDYFKDAAAHLILEVLVNAFGSLTDPRQVYVLRWIAGQRAGIPEFDPLYTIEEA